MKYGDKVTYNIDLSVFLHNLYGIGTIILADVDGSYLVEWETNYKTWEKSHNLSGVPIIIPLTEDQLLNLGDNNNGTND